MLHTHRYPKLFSPLDLGFNRPKNRALMGSGLEEAENGFVRQAAFFAERLRHGIDMITGSIPPSVEASDRGVKPSPPEEAVQPRVITRQARDRSGDLMPAGERPKVTIHTPPM